MIKYFIYIFKKKYYFYQLDFIYTYIFKIGEQNCLFIRYIGEGVKE